MHMNRAPVIVLKVYTSHASASVSVLTVQIELAEYYMCTRCLSTVHFAIQLHKNGAKCTAGARSTRVACTECAPDAPAVLCCVKKLPKISRILQNFRKAMPACHIAVPGKLWKSAIFLHSNVPLAMQTKGQACRGPSTDADHCGCFTAAPN